MLLPPCFKTSSAPATSYRCGRTFPAAPHGGSSLDFPPSPRGHQLFGSHSDSLATLCRPPGQPLHLLPSVSYSGLCVSQRRWASDNTGTWWRPAVRLLFSLSMRALVCAGGAVALLRRTLCRRHCGSGRVAGVLPAPSASPHAGIQAAGRPCWGQGGGRKGPGRAVRSHRRLPHGRLHAAPTPVPAAKQPVTEHGGARCPPDTREAQDRGGGTWLHQMDASEP